MEARTEIIEVFRDNFKEEEKRLLSALSVHNAIAFDTEYPGWIYDTPRNADDEKVYRDLKSNVERTKLIQIGFTVFDSVTSQLAGVWQFNFSGFSPQYDEYSPDAIQLLVDSGIDFWENYRRGVRMTQFTRLLKRIRDHYADRIQWITFHGLYDVAYLLAALNGVWKLPTDILGFTESAGQFFRGGIFDLKYMAGNKNWMGLEKLAKSMGAVREHGTAHQAGSDSLLTAKVFVRAVHYCTNYAVFKGLLFGITVPILSPRRSSPIKIHGYYYPPVD
ncbi:hypothetical protein V2J09_003294 [Rumex salicifolius]